jgi:hypothetical protein
VRGHETGRGQPVVVDEDDQIPLRPFQGRVPRRRPAPVLLHHQLQVEPVLERRDHIGDTAPRPVVAHDHLEPRLGLREQRFERQRQVLALVAGRHDEADRGPIRHRGLQGR